MEDDRRARVFGWNSFDRRQSVIRVVIAVMMFPTIARLAASLSCVVKPPPSIVRCMHT